MQKVEPDEDGTVISLNPKIIQNNKTEGEQEEGRVAYKQNKIYLELEGVGLCLEAWNVAHDDQAGDWKVHHLGGHAVVEDGLDPSVLVQRMSQEQVPHRIPKNANENN